MDISSLLQSPGAAYQISRNTTLPTVNFQELPGIPGMNGVRLHYYDQLGLNPFQLSQGMVRSLGLDQLILPSHFTEQGMDWMANIIPSKAYKGYRAVGNDINAIVRVRSTVTASGYGLEELVLEIATEAGAGTRILSKGHLLWSFSDRQFIVTEEEINADGYQEITLRSTRPDYQIDVIDGQSRDFPDGTPIGQRGVNEYGNGDPAVCEQQYNEYYVQPNIFKSYQLTRKFWQHTLYKQDNQNDIAGGNFNQFYLNIYGVQIPGASSDTSQGFSIAAYMRNFGTQQYIRNLSQMAADMLLSQEATTQDGIMQANGIVENISPQNWYRYRASSELTSNFWRFVLSNTYALKNRGYGNSPTNPLVALCGSKAYEAIMYNLALDRQVQRREDPYREGSDAFQGYLAADRVYSVLTTVLGNFVRFVKFTPLDGRYFTGQRHPENQNLGIHSGDIIILPQGETQEAVLVNDPDVPVAEGSRLVNFYCALDDSTKTPDFMTTQIKESGMRADGSTANGVVTDFGNKVEYRTIATYGAEIADPLAGLYITMR